jgi:hypothetical protein
VAFYDNGLAPTPVMLPVSDLLGPRYPDVPTPTKIDALVVGKLKKLGVVPSDLCTDADFLRRVSLDLTGSLPHPDEVLAFLADTKADKRGRKIDELLERPAYSVWWATRLSDYMGNADTQFPTDNLPRISPAAQWYRWLERRVARNAPYDEIVAGIVLAVGRSSRQQTYEDYCAEMTDCIRTADGGDFVKRKTMPWFWARQNVRTPNEMALSFSYSFLGVRIQCAECHKHPFDQWTQRDFEQFTGFFNRINYGLRDREDQRRMLASYGVDLNKKEQGRQIAAVLAKVFEAGKPIPFQEVFIVPPDRARVGDQRPLPPDRVRVGRVITPKVLGGDEVVDQDEDPRRPLLDWLRHPDNPYFARAIVNRIWANYFNVGIIEPPDDANLANAPSNRELLDYLAHAFVEHKYDLKWLHREIVSSRTYQLSWRTNPTNRGDLRNFSHAAPRRLPAEVLVDAVTAAGASRADLEARRKDPLTLCSIGLARKAHYTLMMFGKPRREIPCDCERSNEPSLLQTLTMQSSFEGFGMRNEWLKDAQPLLAVLTRRKADKTAKNSEAYATALAKARELIHEAYRRTFSRPPSDAELAKVLDYAAGANDAGSALQDLLWALVNSKEFIVNH